MRNFASLLPNNGSMKAIGTRKYLIFKYTYDKKIIFVIGLINKGSNS